ncbi:hypothetical protein CBS101457_003994 [Exobasidium rhododendri]|nr:hypothetical protein CBS101457_003994 [Exobasidium rhododendri]
MGSARVQYEMERTLPSLQLAATHGLFSKEVELRSITQRRREFENALVRRKALVADFQKYLHFEEELETLRVLRVTRLKDQNEISRQDMIKMQKEAISHMVSIYERGVKRLKFHYELWEAYIRWAHSKKMRVVVSRVSARALSLFPNRVDLWLMVANIEFNDHQSASTARALLQRGLRLNSISHPASIQVQADERPKKKFKKGRLEEDESIKVLHISPAGNKADDRASMILSDKELDLVRIWIEYIRMELVFLERLRRRRNVLGISGDMEQSAARMADSVPNEDMTGIDDQVPVSNDGETAPLSIKSIVEGNEVQEAPSSESLLLGAIPKSALRSAISLLSANSLPPKTHFVFLLALASLVQQFPFYNDTEGVRSSLLTLIQQTVQDRFPNNSNALLFVSSASLLNATNQSKLANLSDLELKEELLDGSELKVASHLHSHPLNAEAIFLDCVNLSKGYTVEKEDKITEDYLFDLLGQNMRKVKQSAQVATFIRNIIDDLRDRTLRTYSPNGSHLAFQLRLIAFFESSVGQLDGVSSLEQYLHGCARRVVHDARRLQCDDAEMEREAWKGRIRALHLLKSKGEVKSTVIKLEGRLWETCLKFAKDEALVLQYARLMTLCAELPALTHQELLERWNRVQCHGAGKASPEVWSEWASWVKGLTMKDTKWKVIELQKALYRTSSSPNVHQDLLKIYILDCESSGAFADRIRFIEKKAYPQPSFWRWAIAFLQGSQYASVSMVDDLYTKLLTREENSVDDSCAYLRFLMLKADDPTKGVETFRRILTRMKDDVQKKTILEQEWENVCLELRDDDTVDRESRSSR